MPRNIRGDVRLSKSEQQKAYRERKQASQQKTKRELDTTVELTSRTIRGDVKLSNKEQQQRIRQNKNKPFSEEDDTKRTHFIFIDGEGRNFPPKDHEYTNTKGETIVSEYQAYVLLCASTGESIEDSKGLSSLDCLHFLCTLALKYPKAQFCIFGGGYDANMWLRDMSYQEHKYLREWMEKDVLERVGEYKFPPALGVYTVNDVPHCESKDRPSHPCQVVFTLEWLNRKEFSCTCVEWEDGNFKYEKTLYKTKQGETKEKIRRMQHGHFQCYDVYGFFQQPFMKALESFNLLQNEEDKDFLQNMKDSRRQFEHFDDETIKRYCFKECEYGVRLMEKLEGYCIELGLKMERWDGAGAIASAMMKKYGVTECIEELPSDVLEAATHAFSGGRIELVRYGHLEGEQQAYDSVASKIEKKHKKQIDRIIALDKKTSHLDALNTIIDSQYKRFYVDKQGKRYNQKQALAVLSQQLCTEDEERLLKELPYHFEYMTASIVIWDYDINSAYPFYIKDLPSLRGGTWKLENRVNSDFACCHIKWDLREKDEKNKVRFYPFFYRKKSGMIIYPQQGENWVWLPEYQAGIKHLDKYEGTIELLEVWNFYPATNDKPFSFVPEIAAKRLEWKNLYKRTKGLQGGQHLPAKLGLNSLYGKMVQQIGSHIDKKTGLRVPPPFHNLAWGGYVTASTRARLYDTAMNNPHVVVMFATDGLFVTQPLDGLSLSDTLGEWEVSTVDRFTALQSGVYFSNSGDNQSSKTRGFEVGTITEQMVLDAWNEGLPKTRFDENGKPIQQPWIVTGKTHRFVTIGLLITSERMWNEKNDKRYCCWESVPREQALFPFNTKREIDDIKTPFVHKKWNAAKMLLPTLPAKDEHYTAHNGYMSKAYKLLWLEDPKNLSDEEKMHIQNTDELKEYTEME